MRKLSVHYSSQQLYDVRCFDKDFRDDLDFLLCLLMEQWRPLRDDTCAVRYKRTVDSIILCEHRPAYFKYTHYSISAKFSVGHWKHSYICVSCLQKMQLIAQEPLHSLPFLLFLLSQLNTSNVVQCVSHPKAIHFGYHEQPLF